jgi:hypothetical protein
MIALVLTFLTIGSTLDTTFIQTSKARIFPSTEACERERIKDVMYQSGKHSAEGMHVNGFCIPVEIAQSTGG